MMMVNLKTINVGLINNIKNNRELLILYQEDTINIYKY